MTEWVLGVDGGGTKTVLALANHAGEVIGPVFGSGVNPFDQPRWRDELEALFVQCPILRDGLAFSSVGLPGYGESTEVNQAQLEAVRHFVGERSVVVNDVSVAFTGALAGQSGALILAGTGSMAWARHGALEVRVGGWGEGFGDEGSAFWIGQQALQKLSWAFDGRLDDEPFRHAMCAALGVQDMEGVTNWFYGLEHQRPRVAGLAKQVDHLADTGIATANAILLEAAKLLVMLVEAAWRKVGLESGARISYAGSVFKSRSIREGVRRQLAHLGTWQTPLASPIAGALLDAATRAGWAVNAGWLERVETALSKSHPLERSSQP